MVALADAVIGWQRLHGRHQLPWQASRDPYRIWLAEIMLQQTQVATVLPYFARFVDRFSDVHALAAASSDAVMAAWAGLGYYSRARNLHRCAQQIVDQYKGQFPRTAAELAALPGIGRSTAAAIAAFAFGARGAILDGNVKRVLGRCFGIDAPPSAAVERQLWALAESLLPHDDIGAYTQGMMDLGATVCTAARPACDRCPLADRCEAKRSGRTAELPVRRSARARPVRQRSLLIVRDSDGAVMVERRPPGGIWGGLMSLPEFNGDDDDAALIADANARYGLRLAIERHFPPVSHAFTHFTLIIRPALARVVAANALADHAVQFIALDALDGVGLPAPVKRLLQGVAASN